MRKKEDDEKKVREAAKGSAEPPGDQDEEMLKLAETYEHEVEELEADYAKAVEMEDAADAKVPAPPSPPKPAKKLGDDDNDKIKLTEDEMDDFRRRVITLGNQMARKRDEEVLRVSGTLRQFKGCVDLICTDVPWGILK